MGVIQNTKQYLDRDLENTFFRPMLTGASAKDLGIRVLYNMPIPTKVHLWSPANNVLQPYGSGWSGGDAATRQQKSINMCKIKAEVGFSAEDYFDQVYELITSRADVSFDDLTGTELEAAETELFRAAIAESLRTMMWVGTTDSANNDHNLMNGFITLCYNHYDTRAIEFLVEDPSEDNIVEILELMWEQSDPRLKSLKAEGCLTYYVDSKLYHFYEKWLDKSGSSAAYTDLISGRRELYYHGMRLVDMQIDHCLPVDGCEQDHYALLTDSRNLVLAVNTADMPGSEVRMWYNPDEMQNRQRATFAAGCEILDEQMVTRLVLA